jgi:hypothetical protein
MKMQVPHLLVLLHSRTHSVFFSVNRQLNDKERVAAALENPNLLNVGASARLVSGSMTWFGCRSFSVVLRGR